MTMGSDTNQVILYHANCDDGFRAAWIFWKYVNDGAEFMPVQRGDEPPIVSGKDVLILDFSYPKEMLYRMAKDAASVTILGHHKTDGAIIQPIADELSRVRKIPLPHGRFAYVDESDFEALSKYSWSENSDHAAHACVGMVNQKPRLAFMHRMILSAPSGVLVDHKNRNKLDNRRGNLRLCNRQQNAANMDRGSEFKGVRRCSASTWSAYIQVNRKFMWLGAFPSKEEAAKAYDEEAQKHFGEFARCNFGNCDELAPLNLSCTFDIEKSVAQLTWDRLIGTDEPPAECPEDKESFRFRGIDNAVAIGD